MKKKYYVTVEEKYNTPYVNYSCCYISTSSSSEKEFDNYDDALVAAKKEAKRTKEDVIIYAIDSVVQFPEPDLTVTTAV